MDLTQLFNKLVWCFLTKDTSSTKDETLKTAMAEQRLLQQKKFVPNNDNMKKSSPVVIWCSHAEHNKTHYANALDKIIKIIYDLKA